MGKTIQNGKPKETKNPSPLEEKKKEQQDSYLKTTQVPCQKMKVSFSWKEMSQNTSWTWWTCTKSEVVRNTVKIQFSETELPCILYPRASFCRDIPGRPSPNRKLPGEFSSTPSNEHNQFFLACNSIRHSLPHLSNSATATPVS